MSVEYGEKQAGSVDSNIESTPGIVSCSKEKPRLKSLELFFGDEEKDGAFT